MIACIIIILATVLVDQVSKLLVVNFLDRSNPLVLIEGVFRFSYVENPGMAFGWLGEKPYERWIFMIISTLGIIALIVYLIFFRPKNKMACAALSLIIGGGIGNMIDRLFRVGTIPGDTEGKYVVIDFIDFYAFPEVWKYVFNVADSCVCIGAGILICWCLYSLFNDMKTEKRKIAEEKRNSAADAENTEAASESIEEEAEGSSEDMTDTAKSGAEDTKGLEDKKTEE